MSELELSGEDQLLENAGNIWQRRMSQDVLTLILYSYLNVTYISDVLTAR